ncbi:MAG: glycosyltransferase family 4 protein [Saprospiraceae bacterium]|nr:glycosyltransferase family 4 protein [Saprospiraceae bacterium]
MKIGINARFLLKSNLEGIGWYSYQILQTLVKNHPEHEYIFFFDRPYDPDFVFNKSVTPIVLFPPARHPILWYLWFEFAIPKALKKHKVDLFLSLDGFASLSTKVPQYVVVHDLAYIHFPNHIPFFVRKYYQKFVPRQIEIAKHLFAVSKATKEDIVAQFKIPENKISIAYNGVRSEFKPINMEDSINIKHKYSNGKNYFLYVGAIHPRKNIVNLVKAFNLFKKSSGSDFILMIVGRKAWQFENVEIEINQSLYKEDILLYPYMETKTLADITASCFAAINPSFLEGFGVPILEALYCDVPVLVSNQFSLPEIAGPGAYTFDPTCIDQISDSMNFVINDPNRNQKINLSKIHRTLFSWEKTTEAIYNQFISF